MAQENFLAPSMLHEFAKDDVKLGFRFGTLNNLKKKHFQYIKWALIRDRGAPLSVFNT